MADKTGGGRWTRPFVAFYELLKTEPIQAQAVVTTGVALGSAFDLGFTPTQEAAIVSFTVAVMALITRRGVTPNVSVPHPLPPNPTQDGNQP
jgi:hypothetical protein